MHHRSHTRKRTERAQSVVEFALVAPVFLTLLFGLILTSWLFFIHVAIENAARGAVRAAVVQTSINELVTSGPYAGLYCEASVEDSVTSYAYPYFSIEAATTEYANIVPVDQNPLCAQSSTYPSSCTTPQELCQAPSKGDLTIQIIVPQSPTNEGTLQAPDEIEAITTYNPVQFFSILGLFSKQLTFQAYAELPTYSAVSSA